MRNLRQRHQLALSAGQSLHGVQREIGNADPCQKRRGPPLQGNVRADKGVGCDLRRDQHRLQHRKRNPVGQMLRHIGQMSRAFRPGQCAQVAPRRSGPLPWLAESPAIARNRVVLPAPFGPMMATICPGTNAGKVMSSRIVLWPCRALRALMFKSVIILDPDAE